MRESPAPNTGGVPRRRAVVASESLGVLIAARAVQGVGSAASWISALALVSDAAPADKRGQWLGVALGATGVGSVAGPALGGVAADVLSFEAPFLIFAALAMTLLVAAIGLLPREPPRTRPAAPAPAAIIRSTRSEEDVGANMNRAIPATRQDPSRGRFAHAWGPGQDQNGRVAGRGHPAMLRDQGLARARVLTSIKRTKEQRC